MNPRRMVFILKRGMNQDLLPCFISLLQIIQHFSTGSAKSALLPLTKGRKVDLTLGEYLILLMEYTYRTRRSLRNSWVV